MPGIVISAARPKVSLELPVFSLTVPVSCHLGPARPECCTHRQRTRRVPALSRKPAERPLTPRPTLRPARSPAPPQPKATRLFLQCKSCKNSRQIACSPGFGGAFLPRTCDLQPPGSMEPNCGVDPFVIIPGASPARSTPPHFPTLSSPQLARPEPPPFPITHAAEKSTYIDQQTLKLQENPEAVPAGANPLAQRGGRSLLAQHIPSRAPRPAACARSVPLCAAACVSNQADMAGWRALATGVPHYAGSVTHRIHCCSFSCVAR